LTAHDFAPFGSVIETPGARVFHINDGRCVRHDTLATVQTDGKPACVSLFVSRAVTLPFDLTMMERHPLGSQTFIPLDPEPRWFVTVAPDEDGRPGAPRAFNVGLGQAVSLDRGVWHGALTPLTGPARFTVVDRAGPDNLEEYAFDVGWRVSVG
jgi:ureidoglycolate lyase